MNHEDLIAMIREARMEHINTTQICATVETLADFAAAIRARGAKP